MSEFRVVHLRNAAEDRMSRDALKVFISYSHEDDDLRASLSKHLAPLVRTQAIDPWQDHLIAPGREWEKEISDALEAADIVLLLISPSFFASDYCYDREMARAIERHRSGSARVVPIIIRPCLWKDAPFAKLQALPKKGRAVTKWRNRDAAWEDVAEGLGRVIEELRSRPAALVSNANFSVPFQRNPYFTGREDVLAEIADRLDKGGRAALGQAAICGLGGIGKTQTAVEFAYRHRDNYRAVFFVRAEKPGEILSGFAGIANLVGIVENDQNAAAAAAREWLATHPDWLLILDNADEPALLEGWLPTACHGHVVITSRAQDFAALSIKGQRLAPPADPEALDFLLRRTSREAAGEVERKAAAELATALGNLPLALEQAAAYLVEHGESFGRYLETYRKKGVALFKRSKTPVGDHDPLTVTWSLNFEAVKRRSRASADVLNAIAFLAPDAIPDELFLEGGAEISPAIAKVLKTEGNLAIGTLVAPLLRYSLIERDPEGQTLRVHRLVQEVVKGSLGKNAPKIRQDVVMALRHAFLWPEFETWTRCERLLPHLLAVADKLEDNDELSWLLHAGAAYLYARARFIEAEPLFERSLAIKEKSLGDEHADVAVALNNLAELYRNLGRLSEAEPLFERSLAIKEKSLGDDHAAVATALNNLAILYAAQGRLTEAESLHERSLTIVEKSFGGNHPNVALTLNNLAILFAAQGRLSDAEPLYERSLSIREKSLGSNHPDVATSLNNLAILYADQGRLSEAEPRLELSLAIREKSLGGDHPDVADSLHNLANLYRKQGREAEAEKLAARAREVRARHEARNRRP
jgi:tetratricopeptide (TPR) repeat protein